MKNLFFVYTIPLFYQQLYCPVMEEAFGNDPEVTVRFTMDNSILLDTLANGVVPTDSVKDRLARLLRNCTDAGADCIVVGCTALNTATKEFSAAAAVPTISVDEPMIQKLLADGRRKIAVLSHTPINASTISRRLLAEDPTLEVELFPVAGAGDAFNSGNMDEFHRLMRAGALAIPQGFDAIALGHISAENVDFSGIATPIYKTGACCVEAIRSILR